MISELQVGDKIMINTYHATVRYIGDRPGKSGIWAGLELDQPKGTNNGTLDGKEYFKCTEKCGLFATLEKVLKIAKPVPMQTSQSTAIINAIHSPSTPQPNDAKEKTEIEKLKKEFAQVDQKARELAKQFSALKKEKEEMQKPLSAEAISIHFENELCQQEIELFNIYSRIHCWHTLQNPPKLHNNDTGISLASMNETIRIERQELQKKIQQINSEKSQIASLDEQLKSLDDELQSKNPWWKELSNLRNESKIMEHSIEESIKQIELLSSECMSSRAFFSTDPLLSVINTAEVKQFYSEDRKLLHYCLIIPYILSGHTKEPADAKFLSALQDSLNRGDCSEIEKLLSKISQIPLDNILTKFEINDEKPSGLPELIAGTPDTDLGELISLLHGEIRNGENVTDILNSISKCLDQSIPKDTLFSKFQDNSPNLIAQLEKELAELKEQESLIDQEAETRKKEITDLREKREILLSEIQ